MSDEKSPAGQPDVIGLAVKVLGIVEAAEPQAVTFRELSSDMAENGPGSPAGSRFDAVWQRR